MSTMEFTATRHNVTLHSFVAPDGCGYNVYLGARLIGSIWHEKRAGVGTYRTCPKRGFPIVRGTPEHLARILAERHISQTTNRKATVTA